VPSDTSLRSFLHWATGGIFLYLAAAIHSAMVLAICDQHSVRSWRLAGRSVDEIAALLGCTVDVVIAVPIQGNFGYVPSPTEIARASAKVRSRWTDDERRRRREMTPGADYYDPSVEPLAKAEIEMTLAKGREGV